MSHCNFRPLLLLAFLFLAINSKANFIEFSGKINGELTENKFFLYNKINELTGEEAKYSGSIREDGSFNIAIEIKHSQFIRLKYGEQSINIFARPIDRKIEFAFDALDPSNTVVFSGQRQADNNFLKAYSKSYRKDGEQEIYSKGFLDTKFDEEIVRKAKAYDIRDYFEFIEREKGYSEDYLNRTSGLSSELRTQIRNEIQWQYELNKFCYFIFNDQRIAPAQLSDYWLKYRLLQTVDINDARALVHPRFQNLLSGFIHYLNLENPVSVDSGKDIHYFRFIDRNLNGKCKSFMQAKLMLNAYRMGEPQLAQRKFKEYKRYNNVQEYTKTLEDWFGKNLQYVVKETVKDFQFQLQDGQLKSILDYRGKVVYVSLWASWCKPCIAGFQKTASTRKALADQGVVMLNLNVDKNTSIWYQTLNKLNLSGTNAFAMDLTELQKQMEFDTLPFYMLIDKLGQQSFLSSTDLNQTQADFFKLLAN